MNALQKENFDQTVDIADIRCEIEAMRARLEVLQACLGTASLANPALLGRSWVVQVAGIVALEFGLPLDDLMGASRTPRFIKPRQVWVWLVKTAAGFNYSETARLTGYIEHTMASWSCKRVEDFREQDRNFKLVTDQLLAVARTTRADSIKAMRERAIALQGHTMDIEP
ncbi:helix-turn-helix domain-containing protein [Polymorphobacter sp.]|uniref:helix-turn-helix domain-containing protein n=1 Tax=Polymorphobacter sp. TaxID=1909290 RepID=UPI003F70CDDD